MTYQQFVDVRHGELAQRQQGGAALADEQRQKLPQADVVGVLRGADHDQWYVA